MKEQIPQPAPLSRTLQGKTREANTASVANVLQAYKNGISQRQEVDEDELLQGKFETTQREELEDDDELLQGKFETAQRDELKDDELLQGKFETAQRVELDDDELLQGKFETAQRDELEDDELLQGKFEPTQRQEAPNNTGLPDNLKAGVEQLSGLDMSDVKVHYNSSKPASVQAYAYTQGTDIHVAPGQEKHLGHEAWHVAQQKQGRVQPTITVSGMPVNDNAGLESEADMMGGKAVQMKPKENKNKAIRSLVTQKKANEAQKLCLVDNHEKQTLQFRRMANMLIPNQDDLLNIISGWVVTIDEEFQTKHLGVSRGGSGDRLLSGKTRTPINTSIIADGATLCRLVQQGIINGIINTHNNSPQVTVPVFLTVQEHESALQRGKKGKGRNNTKGKDKVNTSGSGDVEKLIFLTCLIVLSEKKIRIHHYNGANAGALGLDNVLDILRKFNNPKGDDEIKQL